MGFTKKWLYQNRFLGQHVTTFTHLLLSGGKVNIPQEEHKTMCKYYAKDVVAGNPNYITEMRTPVFKFHMDIDLLGEQEIEIDEIIDYCKTIQECIKQFITWKNPKNNKSRKFMMVISISPEQTKIKENKEYIKYGVHLNWPYLKVNTYIASFLREGCIQYLIQKYGERHEDNTWEDVIDKTVYTNNGLRWIYSDKANTCPDCKGRKKNSNNPEQHMPCCACQDSGKIPCNRIYELLTILDGDNNILVKELSLLSKKTFSHVLKCVELLSIQCFDKDTNIEINEPFPNWYRVVDIVIQTKENKKRKEKNPIVQDNVSETGEIKKAFAILEHIYDDDNRYKQIEQFITNFLPEEYEDARIIEILFCGKKNSKHRSYVVRTDSKYCQNIQDDHTSNHVYFVITSEKINQRCFNTHQCAKYIDKGKPLGTKMRELLFPESLETLNEKREQIKYNPNKALETKPLNNMLEQFQQKYF